MYILGEFEPMVHNLSCFLFLLWSTYICVQVKGDNVCVWWFVIIWNRKFLVIWRTLGFSTRVLMVCQMRHSTMSSNFLISHWKMWKQMLWKKIGILNLITLKCHVSMLFQCHQRGCLAEPKMKSPNLGMAYLLLWLWVFSPLLWWIGMESRLWCFLCAYLILW